MSSSLQLQLRIEYCRCSAAAGALRHLFWGCMYALRRVWTGILLRGELVGTSSNAGVGLGLGFGIIWGFGFGFGLGLGWYIVLPR